MRLTNLQRRRLFRTVDFIDEITDKFYADKTRDELINDDVFSGLREAVAGIEMALENDLEPKF